MITVDLSSETDFRGWRRAARDLCAAHVPPDKVQWSTPGQTGALLFPDAAPGGQSLGAAVREVRAPPRFIETGKRICCFRHGEKFARLYRLLYRLQDNPALLDTIVDPDVKWFNESDKAVRRDVHKFHAFVRFRKAGLCNEGREQFVAWFEPSHLTTELAAPFFKRRFPNMNWIIVTPDRTAIWDGRQLVFTAGGCRREAPEGDNVEDQWKAYFSSIFNPARLKVKAMKAEMPMKYWRNLPEAALIPGLIRQAEARQRKMQESAVSEANPLTAVLKNRRKSASG